MRDPERIDETLDIIRQVWREFPDLRLGQLLINAGLHYNTEEYELAYNIGRLYGAMLAEKQEKE